jgi:hypothetical protein
MVDLNFDCPQCGQNLDAPEDMIGLFIECPACTKIIKVPTPAEANKQKQEAKEQSADLRPAPPPVRGDDMGGDEEKGSTMRIQLPPDLGLPEKRKRQIMIKRPGQR